MPSTVSRDKSLPRDSFAASFSQSDFDGFCSDIGGLLAVIASEAKQSRTGLPRRLRLLAMTKSLDWTLHYFRQHAAHVLWVDEEDERPVRADARLAEDAGALGLELGLGGVDVGHLEADMVLPAERVLLEEFCNWRVFPERLDQLDLRIRRVDEAHADTLGGEVECRPMRLRAEHVAVPVEAPLDRRGCHADMIEAAEFH